MTNNSPFLTFKISLIFLIFQFLSLNCNSQIKGVVVDSVGRGLPSVTFKVLREDNKEIESTVVSDNSGQFIIKLKKSGIYNINFSMTGLSDFFLNGVKYDVSNPINLDTVKLIQKSTAIDTISISGRKQLIVQDLNKVTINVEQSIVSSGGTVLELLERSPGVVVDRQNGMIKLRGKEGVLIMINNKQTYLSLPEIMQMLKGVSSGAVTKIDVITNPSSDMDASGNAGIINIVMKENNLINKVLSVNINGGIGRGGKAGADVNYANQIGKLSISTSYSGTLNRTHEYWEVDRSNDFQEQLFKQYTLSDRNATVKTHSGTLRLDYQLNNKLSFGAAGQIFKRQWNMDALNSANTNSGISMSQTDNESDRWINFLSGVNGKYEISKNQKLTMNLDYLAYKNRNKHNYQNNISNEEQENLLIEKETPIKIKVAKADYTNSKNEKIVFKSGAKVSYSTFTNNVKDLNLDNPNESSSVNLNTTDRLKENVYALYSTIDYKLLENIKLDLGVRYEHTNSQLINLSGEKLFNRNFGDLFPDASLEFNISEASSLQVAYNKRILRPSFVDLAPFIVFLDPYTYVTGNSQLKPTYNDSYGVQFRYKKIFSSLEFSNSRNSMNTFQPILDNKKNILQLTPINMDNVKILSMSISFPFRPFSWWDILFDGNYVYHNVKTHYQEKEDFRLSNHGVRLNITQNFKLPKDFNIELSGYYQSPFIVGITKREIPSEINLGASKIINKRSSVSLVVTDIFKTNIWIEKNRFNLDNLILNRRNDYETRIFRVSYTYKLGYGTQRTRERLGEESRVN